jgi:glycosyltransferase involved in cell wall biosynthesis
MAPYGQRILEAEGIDSVYVPHAIDTKTLKETYTLSSGQDVRDYWSSRDRFVVGMVAANKASGLVHRKAFNENLMAFSIFQKKHPDALLYLHTDASGSGIGWNLLELLRGLGVPPTAVSVVNPVEYRYGSKVEDLAAYYSGMDVLLATSMGEGFGVPTIEAQSVGTRVIGSSWAATPDLVSEQCWTVPGNPMWDDNQRAWWQNPQVPAIVEALEQAYAQGKTKAPSAVEFAKRFDVDYVWKNDWMPLLRGQFNDR